MTAYVIFQEPKRDANNYPRYTVHVVDRDAHPANDTGLLFSDAWDRVVKALEPGDFLTEQHGDLDPITVSYEQVQESVRKDLAFLEGR